MIVNLESLIGDVSYVPQSGEVVAVSSGRQYFNPYADCFVPMPQQECSNAAGRFASDAMNLATGVGLAGHGISLGLGADAVEAVPANAVHSSCSGVGGSVVRSLGSPWLAASTMKVVKPIVKQLRDPRKLVVKVEAARVHKGIKLDDGVAVAATLGSLRGSQSRAPQLDKVDIQYREKQAFDFADANGLVVAASATTECLDTQIVPVVADDDAFSLIDGVPSAPPPVGDNVHADEHALYPKGARVISKTANTRAATAATSSTAKRATKGTAAIAASTATTTVGAAALLATAARAPEAAALETSFAESASVDDTSGDDEDEEENAIQEGYYWRYISSDTSSELDQLESIGSLACTCLHGHVVRSAMQQLSRTEISSLSTSLVAELDAQLVAKSWQKQNLSGLLRSDYDGLVLLLSEMVAAIVVEDDQDTPG